MFKKVLVLASALFLFIAGHTQTVTLKQLGKETNMFNSRKIDYFGNYLFAIDNNAALNKVDLSTGSSSQLGTVTYKNARLFFVFNNQLFTVESDGSMNRIDPVTGTWNVVSPIGTWKDIDRAFGVGGRFYTTKNGALYASPTMNERMMKQVGDADFYDLGRTFKTESEFYSLISGTISRIDLATGKWIRVGEKKAWKYTKDAAVLGNKIYSIESPGSLYEADLSTGARKLLDDKQFEKSELLFSTGGKLFTIFRDGQLFEVVIN